MDLEKFIIGCINACDRPSIPHSKFEDMSIGKLENHPRVIEMFHFSKPVSIFPNVQISDLIKISNEFLKTLRKSRKYFDKSYLRGAGQAEFEVFLKQQFPSHNSNLGISIDLNGNTFQFYTLDAIALILLICYAVNHFHPSRFIP